MVKSSNYKTKTETIPNICKKGKDRSTQSRKNTRAPIRKCQDRIKTCQQKIKTKQKCPQTMKGAEKRAKLQKSEDVSKITKHAKVKEEKCSAYFEMDLTEKELRSILRNIPKKFILNMPVMKKKRIIEIQCKIAAYETKKRKILKMVSHEGLKKEEVKRTASNLEKIREKKTEKSTKRKASQEAVILEEQENQVFENPVPLKDRKKEDFWKFTGPFSIPATTRFRSRCFKIKNQVPVVQQFSPKLQSTRTSFSNNSLLNSCGKTLASDVLRPFESTLCSQESETLQFSKKRRLVDICENEMKNRTLTSEQVSSTQLSALVQFSSNPTPKMSHFEPLKLQQQEIIEKNLLNKKLTQSNSQMCLVLMPGERKKINSFTDGSAVLDMGEEKDVSLEPTIKSTGIESIKCIEERNSSNDFQTQIKALSAVDNLVIDSSITMSSSIMQIKNENTEESIKATEDINLIEFKNDVIQNNRESDKKNVRNEGYQNLSCSMGSLEDKNCLNENTISSDTNAGTFTINQSYYSNQNETEKKSSLLENPKIKEIERFSHPAKDDNCVSSQAENICHSYQNGQDRANFDQCNSQALKKVTKLKVSHMDSSLQSSSRSQRRIRNTSRIRASHLQQAMNDRQENSILSVRKKLHTKNFHSHKNDRNENRKTANKIKERENRKSSNYYCKMNEKEREGNQSILGHKIENNLNKKTNGSDPKAIKQIVPQFMEGSTNDFASSNNLKDLQKILNTANGIQHANFDAEIIGHNKNKNFEFSTPIYHNVDLTQSDSETTFHSLNYSEDEPPMDHCTINYHVLKTYLDCDGFPEPFSSPNSSTNIEILNHTQAYGSATSKASTVAVSEDRCSSFTRDSNATGNSSSRSVLSQLSSCDSYLETSSSSDEEEDTWSVSSKNSSYDSYPYTSSSSDDNENGNRSSPLNYNTLQMPGSDNDIYEECSTFFEGQESKQASLRPSMEYNLSQRALNNFSDEELRHAGTKRSSDNMTPQSKSYVNDSLHCQNQERNIRENDHEQKEKNPTSNSRNIKSHRSSSKK